MTSKYDCLADHLAASGAATITLTFAAIEAATGPLPDEARSYAAWWGTTPFGRYTNAHALRWWHAGYVADRPVSRRKVTVWAAGAVTFYRAPSPVIPRHRGPSSSVACLLLPR